MSTSLSLSFELICLMGWLLRNERTTLNALVKQAIKNGLAQDLKDLNPAEYAKVSDQLYGTILDFLMYLEEALANNLDGVAYEKTTAKRMLPAINKKIENSQSSQIDQQTFKISMKQAKAELNKESQKKNEAFDSDDAKKLLYEHIMKNWKPSKNELMH